MELSNEDKVKIFDKLIAAIPELLGTFIVADVRQFNLKGYHIGDKAEHLAAVKKDMEANEAVEPNNYVVPPVPDCNYNLIHHYYWEWIDAWVAAPGVHDSPPMNFDDWVKLKYPSCYEKLYPAF